MNDISLDSYNRWCVGQEILPRIYLGAYPSSLNKEWLKEVGITHIINCREIKHSTDLPGITYIDVIMHDIESQKLKEPCEIIYKAIEEILNSGGEAKEEALTGKECVLLHCTAGVSRSASALIYYIMKKQGISYSKASQIVSKKRSCVSPNNSFVNQLKKMKSD